MLLDYFSLSMANVISKKLFVNLSWLVWIIFRLNFKTFFWQYMLSLYLLLQIVLCNFFTKETSIWFVILVAYFRIISPRPRHSEQICSIVSGLLFNFPEKFAQRPTQSSWRDVCDICYWHLQCLWNCRLWLAVFTALRSGKDSRYGFETSRKHWRLTFVEFIFSLLVRLTWFCGTAKLSKYVLSNFKIDDLSGKFLKDAADILTMPITQTCNWYIKFSHFPKNCKVAKLKPLYKKRH